MYQDYSSPSSSATSSVCRIRQHLHSHSSPLSSAHSSTYGKRATKASDIAHLLDPSYSPTRSTFASTARVYVDHAGEAHDPDFRLFALATYSPKRREFLTSLPDGDYDEDEVEDMTLYSGSRRESFDSYRPTSRASEPSPSYSTTGYENTFTYTYTSYDDAGYASEEEPRRESNKLRRRRDTDATVSSSSSEQRPRSASPTTSHTFRRQWHAIRLRTQFAAFRAKRRMSSIIRFSSTG